MHARGSDHRPRATTVPQEMLERCTAPVRYLREVPGAATAPLSRSQRACRGGTRAPMPPSRPESDSVLIGDVSVARGSHVRLQPGTRRADAQDMFFTGRLAHVEAVFLDVDGNTHLAVTLTDEPGGRPHRWHGRFLYFAPDEVRCRWEVHAMRRRVLVAGIGNIFLSDDGFGSRLHSVSCVSRCRMTFASSTPEFAGCISPTTCSMAMTRRSWLTPRRVVVAPGTIYVIEHDQQSAAPDDGRERVAATPMDAHGMDPLAVLALLHQLGGSVERVLVVACEPANLEEGIGLSDPVAGAIDEAVRIVRELAHGKGNFGTPAMAGHQVTTR